MKKENQDLKKPFFASFLEHQLSDNEGEKVSGGATKKYPTDLADGIVTKPSADLLQTQKYPSDGDEV